jgi:hypothetical protein
MKFTEILMIFGGIGFLGLCFWLGDNGYSKAVGAIAIIIIGLSEEVLLLAPAIQPNQHVTRGQCYQILRTF